MRKCLKGVFDLFFSHYKIDRPNPYTIQTSMEVPTLKIIAIKSIGLMGRAGFLRLINTEGLPLSLWEDLKGLLECRWCGIAYHHTDPNKPITFDIPKNNKLTRSPILRACSRCSNNEYCDLCGEECVGWIYVKITGLGDTNLCSSCFFKKCIICGSRLRTCGPACTKCCESRKIM